MAYTYPIPALNSVILTTFRMLYSQQRLLNTYHWRLVANPGALTIQGISNAINAWFATLVTGLYETHDNMRDQSNVLTDMQCQFIFPTRYVPIGFVLNRNGNVPVGELGVEVTNLAAVITRRDVTGSRSGVGSLHIPLGVSNTQIGDGVVTPAMATKMVAHGNAILNTTAIGSGVILEPVLYHKGAATPTTQIGSFIAQDTLRVMRRRTVRLGI